jgi:2-polyprenyl-3-methyl-5-hydroxy-6-metoxy-1,4-benzoquinol methylase
LSLTRLLQEKLQSKTTIDLIKTKCVICGNESTNHIASGYDFEYATVNNEFNFVDCSKCGHWYLNPRPTSKDLDIIYPKNYYAFSDNINPLVKKLRGVWEGKKVKSYETFIGKGSKRILDVGCGEGRFLSILKEHGDKEWQLVGIDFEESAVKKCRDRGFEAVVSRVEEYREGYGDFDAVIMLQLIEHVDDPLVLAKRVFDLLKPGGVFIIETPNRGGLDFKWFKKRWWGHFHFPRHWHLFTTDSLHSMLKNAGYEIADTTYLISTSSWTISLHNYFLDKGWPEWVVNFFNFQNPLLLPFFVIFDTTRSKMGLQTSNQRVIARKP